MPAPKLPPALAFARMQCWRLRMCLCAHGRVQGLSTLHYYLGDQSLLYVPWTVKAQVLSTF